MEDTEIVSFEPDKPLLPQKRIRETVALAYVKRILAASAPEAIRFQRQLVNDEAADPALRFKASEAILDRFIGKASQEIRVGEIESRPLVFNSKLAVLRAGMKAAIDAETRDESPMEAFADAVLGEHVDREGVTI
jgi:hypothetical protein